MNASTMRALLEDAFYQVLDNKIFRLLLVLVLLIVAPTFLIGFREDSVQVLYGWREVSYDQILSFFGLRAAGILDPQARTIQGFQSFLVEGLCGSLGMVFCISATAFFMPRTLEKGSADILFSKPVSRLSLMLSRYVAGLLFVGILSLTLVFGVYLGLVLVSGYYDPGFLWGAVTLIYLFAILHAFSICVGVFTRSTVAAILISLFLFMGSGCIHQAWRFRLYFQETQLSEKLRAEVSGNKDEESVIPPILEDPDQRKRDSKSSGFIDFMVGMLDVVHYALPKTSDADAITRKLRKAIAHRELVLADDVGHFSISGNPDGFQLTAPDPARASAGAIIADLEAVPALWIAREGGREVGRVEISRRTRLQERPGADTGDAKRRMKRLGTSEISDDVLKKVKASGSPTSEIVTRKSSVDGNYAVFATWTEKNGAVENACQDIVFTFGDWVFEVRATADTSWVSARDLEKRIAAFTANARLGRMRGEESSISGSKGSGPGGERFEDPSTWYERRFGWTSELKFNAFFSIATSVTFALAMLGLAWFKLKRIDF